MQRDLALTDDGYAWVVSIFFFGYLICEVPSNMLLTRSRPSIFLPAIMLVWGILSALMATSTTYGAMLGFRFVLGCIESGFYPGVLYLLSCWYTRKELGRRFAMFYTAAALSGALGGIIAGAITSHLDGAHGIAGWRWLFIIEGCATVGVAIIAFFILLDYPATTQRLTEKEQLLATQRILDDQNQGDAKLSHWQAFMAALSDMRTYLFVLLYMLVIGASTISYFVPTITASLGFETVTAQYMTVPIWVVAAICLNLVAWSSDRLQERRWHTSGSLAVGFAACVICATVHNAVAKYIMVCLVTSAVVCATVLSLTWTSTVMDAPREKRAIVIALVNACGNFASVYGSRIWPQKDSPNYHLGFGVSAGFLGSAAVLTALMPVAFACIQRRAGRRAAAATVATPTS